MAAFCDIVSISDPAANPHLVPSAAANTTIGLLQMEAPIEAGILQPGKYQLTLRIAAPQPFPLLALGTMTPHDEAYMAELLKLIARERDPREVVALATELERLLNSEPKPPEKPQSS